LLNQYLDIYSTERKDAVEAIMEALVESYENNTLGARMINTMLHQYFLNGGKLPEKAKKKISFQKKLSFAKEAS